MLMVSEVDIRNGDASAEVHAVCQAAYALEAERITCADFPPLRESLEELRTSTDRFLVYTSGSITGALSFDDGAIGEVAITRLVVRPARLRQGIATALLRELERVINRPTRIVVSTAETNVPAVALYEKSGYGITARWISAEGIPLISLEKEIA